MAHWAVSGLDGLGRRGSPCRSTVTEGGRRTPRVGQARPAARREDSRTGTGGAARGIGNIGCGASVDIY